MERLVHFSAEPITVLDRTWDYSQGYGSLSKPSGFWVSVEGNGDGWSDWCRDEQWGLDRLTYAHEVTLTANARVLRITTPEGIDALTAEYGITDPRFDSFGMGLQIDWPTIAARHQGILISPYQWSRRLAEGCAWYYGWDCASGCIWDLTAIGSIRPPCLCFETFEGMAERDHAPMCPVYKQAVARTRSLTTAEEATS